INTRLLRRSTRPGCEQRLARCSGFTLRTGAVLLQSTRASCVGAPAPGANNGRLGVLASPFAPRAVLLQSCTRLLRRSTRPGCEQRPARCSGFTLRTEGGAPAINMLLLRRSTRPGCERGDGRSPSQLPTQSVD